MTNARTCIRSCLVLGLLFPTFGFWWSVDRMMALLGQDREPFRERMLRRWAQWTCRIIGVRIRVRGNPPPPPFVLVSNHLGYLDIVVIAATCTTRFVAKRDIDTWPVLGPMIRAMRPIYVVREQAKDLVRANSAIERALEAGESVVLFPEGTSTEGETILPFQPSLLDVPAKTRLPVHYAALTYRTPANELPARKAACWWGDDEFVPHFLQMMSVSCMEATVTFGPQPIQRTDRKELARQLHTATLQQFDPVDKGDDHAPCEGNVSGEPGNDSTGPEPD